MTPEVKKYICERLIDMRDRVKNIHLTYVYESELSYHTIIVEPTSVFEKNSLFHQLEKEMISELLNDYGVSDILFTEKVPYINLKEEEVILRLAPSNIEEATNMTFNYDMLATPTFKQNNSSFVEAMSYALAA